MNIGSVRKIAIAVASVSLCAASASSQAAFTLVDDFEGYALDSAINGKGGWVTAGGAPSVVADPDNAELNRVLSVGGSFQSTYKNLSPIADGTTGTLFYQFRLGGSVGSTWSVSHGLSHLATIDPVTAIVADNFKTRNTVVSPAAGPALRGDDAGTSADFTPVASLANDTWYNLWLVADNAADTYQVYIEGGAFTSPTELIKPDNPLNFRSATTESLKSFLAVAFTANVNTVYFDNIYIDTSGANTSNPIPEPAALGLLASAGALMCRARRRT